MGETSYGKSRYLSVKWEFSKIRYTALAHRFKINSISLYRILQVLYPFFDLGFKSQILLFSKTKIKSNNIV